MVGVMSVVADGVVNQSLVFPGPAPILGTRLCHDRINGIECRAALIDAKQFVGSELKHMAVAGKRVGIAGVGVAVDTAGVKQFDLCYESPEEEVRVWSLEYSYGY